MFARFNLLLRLVCLFMGLVDAHVGSSSNGIVSDNLEQISNKKIYREILTETLKSGNTATAKKRQEQETAQTLVGALAQSSGNFITDIIPIDTFETFGTFFGSLSKPLDTFVDKGLNGVKEGFNGVKGLLNAASNVLPANRQPATAAPRLPLSPVTQKPIASPPNMAAVLDVDLLSNLLMLNQRLNSQSPNQQQQDVQNTVIYAVASGGGQNARVPPAADITSVPQPQPPTEPLESATLSPSAIEDLKKKLFSTTAKPTQRTTTEESDDGDDEDDEGESTNRRISVRK